jgi:hypothetical protein
VKHPFQLTTTRAEHGGTIGLEFDGTLAVNQPVYSIPNEDRDSGDPANANGITGHVDDRIQCRCQLGVQGGTRQSAE